MVCVPLTGKLRWADATGNVLLTARMTGLPRDSVANVSQVVALDRTLLEERVGRVSRAKIDPLLASLVPLHRGFDRLKLFRSTQDGKVVGVDEHLETSSPSRGSAKEPCSLQGEDHLVNARRGDGEEPLQVGLGGRATIDLRVGMDER